MNGLPIGFDRIRWKLPDTRDDRIVFVEGLPIGVGNESSLPAIWLRVTGLPIGFDRIYDRSCECAIPVPGGFANDHFSDGSAIDRFWFYLRKKPIVEVRSAF